MHLKSYSNLACYLYLLVVSQSTVTNIIPYLTPVCAQEKLYIFESLSVLYFWIRFQYIDHDWNVHIANWKLCVNDYSIVGVASCKLEFPSITGIIRIRIARRDHVADDSDLDPAADSASSLDETQSTAL